MTERRVDIFTQGDELLSGHPVSVGREDIGSDMRMQRVQAQIRIAENMRCGTFGLPVGQRKSELRPCRVDAGVEPNANADFQRLFEVFGQRLDEVELIPVIDLNQRALADGPLQNTARLVWPIEHYVPARKAELAGLLVLEIRYDFGEPALLTQ